MADEEKVCAESKQIVLRIHEKLKNEIHEIAEKKSYTAEQKEEFEKKLLELYKDSVEETIKGNVAIGGQEWNNVSQAEGSSTSVVQEEMEPLNRDRVTQVFTLCSELEDLFKDTTSKRKKYPQQITRGIKSILQRQKELLEMYQSSIKSDSSVSSLNVLTPDFEDCIQRLQSACDEVAQLSKSFPELHSKAVRLQQVVQSHKAMQKSETDAVLFGRESNIDTTHTSYTDTLELHNEQSQSFIWWTGSKRKSQPPQRYDASLNTYTR